MKRGVLAGAVVLVLWAVPVLAQGSTMKREEPKAKMEGVIVQVGGGVESYTGSLAPEVNLGPAYGARVQFKPTRILGLELGYNGALNNIDKAAAVRPEGLAGPDLIRNGGEVVATVGLTETRLQPYLLAGVGMSRYTLRGEDRAGFQSDNTGHFPLGAGLRAHFGQLNADARLGYSVLFDQQFATAIKNPNAFSSGRYAGTLNVGAAF